MSSNSIDPYLALALLTCQRLDIRVQCFLSWPVVDQHHAIRSVLP